MKLIIDILVGGFGKAIGASLVKLFGLIASDKMVATVLVGLLSELTQRTKNTLDDKILAQWKEEIIKSGIDIK